MAISFEESRKAAMANISENVTIRKRIVVPGADDMNVATEVASVVRESPSVYEASDETWVRADNYSYPYYSEFSDDRVSTISQNKIISLDPGQINISQEDRAQFIPFEMPRYYDGMDLSRAVLRIYFVNKEGNGGFAQPVNVQYSASKIRFGWLVDQNVTAVAGKVSFEIHANGTNSRNEPYTWKTRPSHDVNILESLSYEALANPGESWITSFFEDIDSRIETAQEAAAEATGAVAQIKEYADQAYAAAQEASSIIEDAKSELETTIDTAIDEKITSVLNTYYTKNESDAITDAIAADVADVKTQLENMDGLAAFNVEYDGSIMTFYNGETVMKEIAINSDPSDEWTTNYTAQVDEKIGAVQTQLDELSTDVAGLPQTLATDYYTKTTSDERFATKDATDTNKQNITTLGEKIADLEETVASVDTSPRLTYDIVYNDLDDANSGENKLVLYEIENEGKENEVRSAKRVYTIAGGSGSGPATSNLLYINFAVDESGNKVTSYIFTTENVKDKTSRIYYDFSGTDPVGDSISYANAIWQFRRGTSGSWTTIASETIYPKANNEFDICNHVSTAGTYQFKLIATDETGGYAAKTWTVELIDLRLESGFNDKNTYPIGPVAFDYTPYGGTISKDIHFILDGNEIKTITTNSSGIPNPVPFEIPAQEHGSHLLEAYITARLTSNPEEEPIESDHIFRDIMWVDPNSDVPVISCRQQKFTAMQYSPTEIEFAVYDPNTETPTVVIKEDGVVLETRTMDGSVDTYSYKSNTPGEHILTITCGETVKTLVATIKEVNIDISPVTLGLVFDFDPAGRSNNSADRIWSSGDVVMSVSDNFDWINGGYQLDENGDGYFCVKAGTSAVINYQLFADDAKTSGKEFKVVFKTSNIKKRDTSFISCMNNGIGLDMKVESANIYASNNNLYSPYCEKDIIEFEFNIKKNDDIPLVLTYEDGVGNRPMIYTSDASFWQSEPQPITIGSDSCDVHVYRMKAYTRSLSDSEILSNFIADARNADEMIDRYNRNQIYDENNALTPEVLAEKCPDLRIIMIDAPWFTNDKDNKVDDTTIRMIYKNGDPVLDNWICTGARHSGQGTSSNEYGYAGRNIDLIMDRDTSLFELGDGTTSKTITLTRSSVPTDYLNVKVNIASSENENNAQMARRYNTYNPFVRAAKFNNNNVKDCMEFYNCVIFVKERDTDISTHREFQDCNYHFYGIGNVGDSKKTDDTRVNDKNDPKECVLEITDYNVPLAEFPTGIENGGICPVDDWKEGNTAYDYLYAGYKYKEGEFKSFGSESYEFRYEMKGITEEQRQVNIDAWRDLYKFIVTSTDEEFYSRLKEHFVVDSALYYYLFTERYTMVDNRAKNSFWHRGKVYITDEEAIALGDAAGGYIVDNEQAAISEGYRWDLSFGYDFDTSLGIDNTGKLVLTYGKEDIDYYVDGDPSSSYIYRAAESTFFCRLRDLFSSEMQGMFVNREDVNAWSASSLISQWDEAQNQFPEELWRLDIQRKYIRTYKGISVDNSIAKEANPRFLTEMMNGRKKYQRRMFERNQELYMATKYFGKTATQDQIMMRFNNPEEYIVKPDFTLYLTPYSDMYIGVKFGNVTPINFRAKAGVEYSVPYSIAANTADITLIYGASFIQAIGDLSACYVGDNDFSKASRLQSLVIGSSVDGYVNNYMSKISLGNNPLLEYLDIRNTAGLSSVVDLSQCGNLLELRAEGSGANGVIFANGGKLERFYIPDVTSLTMKNLSYIQDFLIEGYDNLQKLIVEYTPAVNTYDIVNSSPMLNSVRLIGIDWDMDNTTTLNKILVMRGVNNDGGEIAQSVMTGSVYVLEIRERELMQYNEKWHELEVTYDPDGFIHQQAVTFYNGDGSILEVQYVDFGTAATDPAKRSDNPVIPVKESTVENDFTFETWDRTFELVLEDLYIHPVFKESIRQYTIKYLNKDGAVLQIEEQCDYGSYHPYTGATPTYTVFEDGSYIFYLFKCWDKSGFIDGDRTVNAIYDEFRYTSTAFEGKEFKDMTPVEIYALTKLTARGVVTLRPTDENNNVIEDESIIQTGDEFSFYVGNDIDFSDIESRLLVAETGGESEPLVFTGTKYHDTGVSLMDVDRDFVLAIDYEFTTGNEDGAVLAQCFQDSVATGTTGFKLAYKSSSSSSNVMWEDSSETIAKQGSREVLVIRHKKGSNVVHIYNSNLSGTTVSKIEMDNTPGVTSNETIIFGCSKAGRYYENYAFGKIYWCKLWYADLGDATCTDLAMWPHESVTLQACGFDGYDLSDGSGERDMVELLATHLMDRESVWGSTNNTGGWANASLNRVLNDRLYNAIPSQIKSILKQVSVKSTAGGGKGGNTVVTDVTASDCHIWIPAVREVASTESAYSGAGYSAEARRSIAYMLTPADRIRSNLDGTISNYWLRSPNTSYPYVLSIDKDGKVQAFKAVTSGATGDDADKIGILIMLAF